MWKCLFAYALLSYHAPAFSQGISDSLGKYSYLVQIDQRCEKTQATGFFARYQQRLFFITAAHCLTGWDPAAMKPIENFPDTIFIRLSNGTSQLQFLPLPVANIKKATRPFNLLETPDVFVVEIKNPKKYKVNSIEEFFDEEVPCGSARQVVVTGYPNDSDSSAYYRVRQQPFTLGSSVDDTYCMYPYHPDVKVYDRLHYYASFKDNIEVSGLSGAPVYLVTDDESIIFGGIYIGGMRGASSKGMVVRAEYVINKIMDKIYKD